MSAILTDISLSLVIISIYMLGQRMSHELVSGPKIATWVVVPLVALPSLLQIPFPALFSWLSGQPDLFIHYHEYWRLVTAMLVQDGGVIGTLFNLISLILIVPLADTIWGWKKTILIFFASGIVLDALSILFGAVSSGSSGATFTLATSIAGAYILLNRPSALYLLALFPVVIGLALTMLGNAHGYAMLAGVLIGLLLAWFTDTPQHK